MNPPAALALLDLFSGPEMLIVLLVVLIFFGGERMPEFARGMGKVMRELRKAAGEVEREVKKVMEEAERTPPSAAGENAPRIAPPLPAPGSLPAHSGQDDDQHIDV